MDCQLDQALLTECDRVMSKCGRPKSPPGVAYVMIECPFLYNVANAANQAIVGTREISGPTDWQLESITIVQSSPAFIRIQLPNGRYLSNYLMDIAPNAYAGSFQRTITCPLTVQPGQKFRIITDTTPTGLGASNISVLFNGSYRFAVNGKVKQVPDAAQLARYFQTPNGNILAPEMDLDLDFSEVPKGWKSGEFKISTLPLNGTLTTPGGQTTLEILLDQRYDWSIRRLTFEQSFQDGVTGVLSCIPRDSAGFSLSTDYIPTAIWQAQPYAHTWDIAGGQSLFFDFQLANTTGQGSVTFSANAICWRRKRQ